jgi:hypothetical protein
VKMFSQADTGLATQGEADDAVGVGQAGGGAGMGLEQWGSRSQKMCCVQEGLVQRKRRTKRRGARMRPWQGRSATVRR